MLNSRRLWVVAGLGVVLFFGTIRSSLAAGRQFLQGHIPEAVSRLRPIGRFPGTNRLSLVIGLPLRNQEVLDDLLRQIYDPASPNFRQYLTPEQFAEQFSPSEQDYQTLIAFAEKNGLMVTGMHPNRTLLNVSGSVADIERVFHVTISVYHHPKEARTFYVPDVEPSLDLTVRVLHIGGLDNYSLMRPASLKIKPASETSAKNATPDLGSGPGGAYAGNDFRAAYVPGVSLDGSGQIVALVEFDGYHTNDIRRYELSNGIPNITLTNVLLDGAAGSAGGGNVEVALDIDMVIAMATNLSKVVVYEAPNNTAFLGDILNHMATDIPLAKQLSSSWFSPTPGTNAGLDQVFMQFAAQGQSYFQASGDNDAYTGAIPSPQDDSFITVVGGTTLSTTGPGGAWVSETVWNWGGGTGSGGGISTIYPIPSWQTNLNMSANHGSTTFRNIPDVAMTADNIWIIASNGVSITGIGGTSAAAPLWAGFTALVNQQALAKGKPTVGFINPAIYAIGNGPNYASDFNDITTGNNKSPGSPGNFSAVTGYDLCTGWGTPNGLGLINALAVPDSFGIFPGAGFTAYGPVGGPFSATVQNFALTNSGETSLSWLLTDIPPWLDVSSVGGALAAGDSTTITVNLNSTGSNLLAGVYSTNLIFTNLTSGLAQSRLFTLQSGQSIVQNGGFETGDFTGWTLVGNTTSGNNIYNAVVSAGTLGGNSGTNFIHSGTYGAFLGDIQIATLSQTLNTFPGQGYLLSFWLANPVSGSVQQFLVNWNTNSPGVNQIYYLMNPPVLTWTNITLVVTATGTNTTLQFGARNDPNGFGLDDVNVWPIPNPSFRSVAQAGTNIVFSWNSLAGIAYQVQYSTNLTKTNWTSLSTNTAIGFVLTFTNAYGTNQQRFYRIRQLP